MFRAYLDANIEESKIKEKMERTKKGRAISDPALKPNS
jgi:hypothetical protein